MELNETERFEFEEPLWPIQFVNTGMLSVLNLIDKVSQDVYSVEILGPIVFDLYQHPASLNVHAYYSPNNIISCVN